MDDLSAVETIEVPGGYQLTAEKLREQIVWAQKNRHANCYFQRHIHSTSGRTFIVITDLFDPRWPTMSVTNDAEFVVRKAVDTQGDYPIVYRDTDGNYDELRHREGYFATFRALATRDYEEAIDRVIALHEQDKAHYEGQREN